MPLPNLPRQNLKQKRVSDLVTTRATIEAELKTKSEAISDSMGRIRQDLSLPKVPAMNIVRKHPVESAIAVAAVGLAVGLLFTGGKKQKRRDGDRGDRPNDEMVALLSAARAAGLSDEDAVRHVAASVSYTDPPRHGLRNAITSRLSNQLVGMIDVAVRTVASIVAREAAAWLSESLKRDKKTSSQ